MRFIERKDGLYVMIKIPAETHKIFDSAKLIYTKEGYETFLTSTEKMLEGIVSDTFAICICLFANGIFNHVGLPGSIPKNEAENICYKLDKARDTISETAFDLLQKTYSMTGGK